MSKPAYASLKMRNALPCMGSKLVLSQCVPECDWYKPFN